MKTLLPLTVLVAALALAACGGTTQNDCANWSCGTSTQCAAVMGASSGSQCGFSGLSACQDWCNQYIPGSCSCGAAKNGGGGGGTSPTANATALQVVPGQSFYACSDALGASFMPQTPLAIGGNPTSAGYAWSMPAGQSLPAGLTVQLNGSGVVVGTISTGVPAGTYPLTLTVSDGAVSATGSLTIVVVNDGSANRPPFSNGYYQVATHLTYGPPGTALTTTSCPVGYGPATFAVTSTLPSTVSNQKYGANAFVAGVTSPSWNTTPLYGGATPTSLPPGLQLNPVNGTLYGAITAGTAPGNYQFTVSGVTSYSGGNQPGNGYSTNGGAKYVVDVTQ